MAFHVLPQEVCKCLLLASAENTHAITCTTFEERCELAAHRLALLCELELAHAAIGLQCCALQVALFHKATHHLCDVALVTAEEFAEVRHRDRLFLHAHENHRLTVTDIKCRKSIIELAFTAAGCCFEEIANGKAFVHD